MQRNSKESIHKATICEEGDLFSSTSEGANSVELHPPTQVGGSQTSGNGASESQTHKKIAEDGKAQVWATFDDMGLREGLLRGIYAFGYEKPSAIQQRAVVPCCRGRDVIAQAQSGAGKTATFAIALIEQLDLTSTCCQVCSRCHACKTLVASYAIEHIAICIASYALDSLGSRLCYKVHSHM